MVMNSIKFIITIIIIVLFVPMTLRGQEYKVESMTMDQMDLTARTSPRVDLNGRKCAVLKVFVADKIVDVEGNVIGNIETKGMQKAIYVTHDTKQVNLLFENHMPLRVIFDDYGIASVTERMVYIIKLVESASNAQAANQSQHKPTPPPAHTSAPVSTSYDPVRPISWEVSNSKIETFTVNGVSFDMIRVEGGNFMMGSDKMPNETPVHQENIRTFYIGKTELIQEVWEAVMGNNPSPEYCKGKQKPVSDVSWEDCQVFITRLNHLTGKQFRLPTEAEWEYAARGGNKSRGFTYSGSNNPDEVAWYNENSSNELQEVAHKLPNELGIYDMSGNVEEWCSDGYSQNYTSPRNNSNYVSRGGSYRSYANNCRVEHRYYYHPKFCRSYVGLRLAL